MKKNITLVCTLLSEACLKAQTAVNISGANTATWTALSFHSLFKGLKQIKQKALFSFLLSIVAGFFCQGDAQPIIIYGASYVPCAPSEQVTAPFTLGGQVTTNSYSGLALITVSGTGYSRGTYPNDAFYFWSFTGLHHEDERWKLGITTEEGTIGDDDGAYLHIVYDVDASNAVTPPGWLPASHFSTTKLPCVCASAPTNYHTQQQTLLPGTARICYSPALLLRFALQGISKR